MGGDPYFRLLVSSTRSSTQALLDSKFLPAHGLENYTFTSTLDSGLSLFSPILLSMSGIDLTEMMG